MRKVSSPSHFPEDSYIASFSGKNYEEAIKLAGEWSGRTGATLVSYYEQTAHGKSILVSYKKENEDGVRTA
jgi:hypothetical protein